MFVKTRTESPTEDAAASVVRVRFDQFDRLCDAKGWANDFARSRALGISHTHLSRVRSGHVGVGGKFIGAALAALGVPFEAVFERVPEEAGAAR